jgi:CSLREA domain-containing protein
VTYAATITVTTTADELNRNSKCSLREAIRAANLNTKVGACPAGKKSKMDTISLPPGTYVLTRTGADENATSTGDLDVTGALKIVGTGASTTRIDGNAADRVLEIQNGATLTLTSVTVQAGKVGSGVSTGKNGGGISNAGQLTLDHVTVRGNSAEVYGGGIFNTGTLNVMYSTVTTNSVLRGVPGGGGGIYTQGTLEVFKSTISDNQAKVDGVGGGILSAGSATLTNSTVSSNTSTYNGSGIGNGTGTLRLYSSTVTLNTGGNGGITSSGSITMVNTILARNTVGSGSSELDCYGVSVMSQGYNLIGNTQGCTIEGDLAGNMLNLDAKLGPLQNNGGPTFTHALQPGSPAIDAGNPVIPGSSATACPAKDQRDVHRPQDGNGDGHARCDIGTFER